MLFILSRDHLRAIAHARPQAMAQRGGLWDLTPYELDRQPHLLSQDNNAVIRTTGRLLESELQCAICLDVLRKTMTTKECLHRFCDECIRQALRNGNKECPNCRQKLISMRALRPDPLFDDIIKTIFPRREIMEERHAALLGKLCKDNPKKGPKAASAPANSNLLSATASLNKNDAESLKDEDIMSFELQPYLEKMSGVPERDLPKALCKRLVRVMSTATVDHVRSFIASRFLVEEQRVSFVDQTTLEVDGIKLYIRVKNSDIRPLRGDMTVKQVHETYWNVARPMQLLYSVTGSRGLF